MKDIEEGLGEFVISRGDRAVDLQMSDHTFDAIALAIDAPVPADIRFACGFGWDAATDARVVQAGTNGICVIALIGEEIGGPLIGKRDHIFERRAVCGFAGREMEDEREPSGITETMNFTGEPAPRAAKSLFASPPFAPAAET